MYIALYIKIQCPYKYIYIGNGYYYFFTIFFMRYRVYVRRKKNHGDTIYMTASARV